MITIKEDLCKHIPGIHSLFIMFSFNNEIVEGIKETTSTYHYDKKTKIWEVPINCLSDLVMNLIHIDSIEILLLESTVEENKIKTTLEYKTTPFIYQKEGIVYGLNHPKWLLLDAPGLGKTLQMIYLAEELKAQNGIEHCLIICGVNSLKTNWKREIEKHSTLDSVIIGELHNKKGNIKYASIQQRALQLSEKINEFFVIINIESLRSNEILEALNSGVNNYDLIIVDEIHTCKNITSLQAKNLLKLKGGTYKVALTGTLILNSPLDSFLPLKWIGIEKSTFSTYRNFYCIFDETAWNQVIGFKNTNILKDQLSTCSLRRTKDLLELPEKTIINEIVEMNETHRKFYEAIKNGVKEEANKISLKTSSLLALTTRLRQATACPTILTSKEVVSSKIERAIDLIKQITNVGDKVVVFSTFKETIEVLKNELEENYLVITGDTKDDVINIVDKFQRDDSYSILLATWQRAGTGLTLTSARYMIFIDNPWTAAVQTQCEDRIHRIGTKEPVFIYNLICKDTIDERVIDIINTKESISDYIIDDRITENGIEILRKYIEDL